MANCISNLIGIFITNSFKNKHIELKFYDNKIT